MPNRETWDWTALEPDNTMTMTLLWDRNATIIKDGKSVEIKDDGRKEGADYDWHRYPVQAEGVEWTMFTSSELMHSALQALGVAKKGDVFRTTKKLGYNRQSGKSYTYYEVERDGTRLRTDQLDTPPPETPQQQAEKISKEEGVVKPTHEETAQSVYGVKMAILQQECPAVWKDEKRRAELIVEIFKSSSAEINTLVMQNGGKR